MKPILYLWLLLIGISFGCDRESVTPHRQPGEGLTIVSNGKQVLGPDDIEFYDFSTHLIYLKPHRSFAGDYQEIGDFTVFANGEEIYSGQTLPGSSSYLPVDKVIIRTSPSFYGDYILPLSFSGLVDSEGHIQEDPREDERIITALKQHDQFHAGLSCEIRSVSTDPSGEARVSLVLTNPDDRNYYYLDPDKMGVRLFHYFTNGLYIGQSNDLYAFTHQLEAEHPESADAWKMEWLSILPSHESVEINLTYPDFETVTPGQYLAFFQFPGLGIGMKKEDLSQADGRIWLGNISMVKDVLIR